MKSSRIILSRSTAFRSDMCGELRAADAGRAVTVCGWVFRRREHSEHLAFVDVRDHTGIVQCVIDGARDLRSEFVVRVSGTVALRPPENVNDKLATAQSQLYLGQTIENFFFGEDIQRRQGHGCAERVSAVGVPVIELP